MLKKLMTGIALICSLAVSGLSSAQDTPALTLEMAERAMVAAMAESRANNWNLTIVIADVAGVPVMVHRMDGASARTFDIAMAKARVVTATGLSSGEYGRRLQAGEIAEVENGVTFAGGVPIMLNGERIGAITSSGARGVEDEQVSLAGAAVIGN
ncbi:MAG: heme-binding protein [Gammaproteobacteria bacterium]|nr:heme-binding protein [Gammaproteobacteria bacterium]